MLIYICTKYQQRKELYIIMIKFLSKKINRFDVNNLEIFSSYTEKQKYIQSFMPDITDLHINVCPCCHAKNKLIKYGTYERNLSILVNDNVENYIVSVQRVICTSCNHTHALLLDFIVPYKIMALPSIAKIVQRASVSSAYKLAEAIKVSVQLIYTYIAIVLAFFNDFRVLNNSKEYFDPINFNQKYFLINCIKISDVNYRLDYFEFYNWLLFMQKFRNSVSPPITISISKVPPT